MSQLKLRFSNNCIYISGYNIKELAIAGDWNNWAGSAIGKFCPEDFLLPVNKTGEWYFKIDALSNGEHEFKFIIDGRWEEGFNRKIYIIDGQIIPNEFGIKRVFFNDLKTIHIIFKENVPRYSIERFEISNLTVDSYVEDVDRMIITLKEEAKPYKNYKILITNDIIVEKHHIKWEDFIKNIYTDKRLGVFYDSSTNSTKFRVFSPRAKSVKLLLLDPKSQEQKELLKPSNWKIKGEFELKYQGSGLWEKTIENNLCNEFYQYIVSSDAIDNFEGFGPRRLCDPYARCNVYHRGPSIIFTEPKNVLNYFKNPDLGSLIIYELHIRDFTIHSNEVPEEYRGKYYGFKFTENGDTGIGHLKELGINAVEIMPVFEFEEEPIGTYHWGYMPSLWFVPDAQYATDTFGSQIKEFKELIELFHNNGMAVILDVVYNHTGGPHHLMGFDKLYYYRHNDDGYLLNYSGCGNDFRSEFPMARRIIIDSLKYWVQKFGIDGFRFDLAELIDIDTLKMVENELKNIRSDIILIAEPWSFRGTNKHLLRETEYSSWNDDFRERVKGFLCNKIPVEWLEPVIDGSVSLWTKSALQSINYVESHDDMTLIDFLASEFNKSGVEPSEDIIGLFEIAAVLIFMSRGIPMITEGQEFIRSKYGINNSYNSGDSVNGIKWERKEKFLSTFNLFKELIAIRKRFNEIFSYTKKSDGFIHYFYDRGNNRAISYLLNANNVIEGSSILISINASFEKNANFEDHSRLLKSGIKLILGKNISFGSLTPLSFSIYEVFD